ncbi:hypothetical protein [Ferruginivarius sediminum]|uniref:hypothetical protein n=1 Tax=Ferruginivarius sediminum TaxID=2661937 RepID=UPI0011C01815|nr:hypothetical protein [Ferruginivarius sediminum]
MSGRILSICDNIREDAEDRVKIQKEHVWAKQGSRGKDFKFVAVMYVTAASVRNWQIDKSDVIYSPSDFDLAHANLVFYTLPPDKILQVIDELIQLLSVCSASEAENVLCPKGGQNSSNQF